MSIIEKTPIRCNQGTEVARFVRWTRYAATYLQSYTHMRLHAKHPAKQMGCPNQAPLGKAACYYSYPLALPVGHAQILVQLAIPGDLNLLLREVIERFLTELAKRLLACI